MATLLFAAILIVTLGLAALSMAKVGVSEHRQASNFVQAQKLAELSDMSYVSAVDSLRYRTLERDILAGKTTPYLLSIGGTTAPVLRDANNKQLAKYTVTVTDATDIRRVVLGVSTSLDTGALGVLLATIPVRNVQLTTDFTPAFRAPDAPVVACGAISVTSGGPGLTTTVLNQNPLTSIPNLPAWSFAAITTSGMNFLVGVGVPLPNDATYLGPLCATADIFFENFFTKPKLDIFSLAMKISCAGICQSSANVFNNVNASIAAGDGLGGLVWVTQPTRLNSAITLGSADDPVVLIVAGDLDITHANVTIFGAVYVAGRFTMNGGKIWGAVLVEQTAAVGNGAQLVYDNAVVGQGLATNGQTTLKNTEHIGDYKKLAGSWRD